MAAPREDRKDKTLDQLADEMQYGPTSGSGYHIASAELERRKAIWQQEAADAQKEAAASAESAAHYTKANARYMLWSVWAILFAAVISAFLSFMSWQFPHK